MTKTRLFLGVGVLVVVVACTGLVVSAMLQENRPGVTLANFDRVQIGTTLGDVDTIFGERFSIRQASGMLAIDGSPVSYRVWLGDDGQARIGFANGRVCEKRWTDTPRTLPEKIRQWLRVARN